LPRKWRAACWASRAGTRFPPLRRLLPANRPEPGVNVTICRTFSSEKIGEKIGDFESKYSRLERKFFHNILCQEKRPFHRILVKIAENRDHNIDPEGIFLKEG
jgi:hypothetical protein